MVMASEIRAILIHASLYEKLLRIYWQMTKAICMHRKERDKEQKNIYHTLSSTVSRKQRYPVRERMSDKISVSPMDILDTVFHLALFAPSNEL